MTLMRRLAPSLIGLGSVVVGVAIGAGATSHVLLLGIGVFTSSVGWTFFAKEDS